MKLFIAFLTLAISCFAADVTGKWTISAPTRSGAEVKYRLTIQGSAGSYSGIISADEGEVALKDVKVNDAELSFVVETDDAHYEVTATVTGDTMKGGFKINGNAGGSFTGTREGGSKQTSSR
jgi:hypothetical protein